MPSNIRPPPSLVAKLFNMNRYSRFLYNHWRKSLGIFGVTGALGVVWLFDVQMVNYLRYVPVFRTKFQHVQFEEPEAKPQKAEEE